MLLIWNTHSEYNLENSKLYAQVSEMTTFHRYKMRKKWKKEEISAEVAAVRAKRMGYVKAVKHFNRY